ncbi:MAG TPA: glycosyltransferase [Clostridiales bacterium]|nr:glycosyltransferase [Clostridiales bacterium]
MKVLQINVLYRRGSTGKIVNDLNQMLKRNGYESYVCYGRGKAPKEQGVYKISSDFEAKLQALFARFGALQYGGAYFATSKLLRLLKKIKPDIVHLHCINGYTVNIYRLMNFLKANGIPTILTLHAEFLYTGSCGYAYECEKWKSGCGSCPHLREATRSLFIDRTAKAWLLMKKTFENFDVRIVSVSEWLDHRARQSPILKGKEFNVIYNGVETEIFKPKNAQALKLKYNINDEKALLFVTPDYNDERKGGKYITELAKKLLGQKIKIFVIGFNGDYKNLPENIVAIRFTNNQEELSEFYSLADLTLLASKRETFSMVVAESLCCGTPVVGFKAGAPELIALENTCEFVEYGDVQALYNAVIKNLNKKRSLSQLEQQKWLEEARKRYSKEAMFLQYDTIYKELVIKGVAK